MIITAFFIFALGAIMGSFASAVLYRVHSGESFVYGRSHCVYCKRVLGARDLVPVASYITSGGRCRQCGKAISWQYPALELGMGVLFLFAYLAVRDLPHPAIAAVRLCIFSFILVLAFVYDARHSELPDLFSVAGIAAGLAFNILSDPANFLSPLLGILAGGGFFALQFLVSRGKWVGSGDILLGAAIGAMVGWPGIANALFIAYMVGLVSVLVLMVVRRKHLNDAVPMGPFLVTGALAVLYLGINVFRPIYF